MGWNNANYIFDPVAEAIIKNRIDSDAAIDILTILIRNLQSEDWDTEDESLEQFAQWPAVVEAFEKCGVPYRETFDEEWNSDFTPRFCSQLEVPIRKLDKELPLPIYAHDGDAGIDLVTTETFRLMPLERRLVPTGIAMAIPYGYVGLVHPRSGLANEKGVSIVNAPGTVDAGYRGEIKVNLINLDYNRSVSFKRGDRIAQMVFQKVEQVQFEEVNELPESVRGVNGHGSTGLASE